jgi:hypothetical protein
MEGGLLYFVEVRLMAVVYERKAYNCLGAWTFPSFLKGGLELMSVHLMCTS